MPYPKWALDVMEQIEICYQSECPFLQQTLGISYVKWGHSIIDMNTIYEVTEQKMMVDQDSCLSANTKSALLKQSKF